MVLLLTKLGEPRDWTLCGRDPVLPELRQFAGLLERGDSVAAAPAR
jgi:hypothetical protein